jgi:hypothetical protein
MNADINSPIDSMQRPGTPRSRQSLEFEAMWRALPKDGAVPHRCDFNPARAAPLLRYIMLIEMRFDETPSFPVRLVGSTVVEKIQRDLRGHDYLEFMPPEYHAGVTESARLMLNHPCGLWQITQLHFERGFAQSFEVTAFPLLGEPSPFCLALLVPRDEFVRPLAPGNRLMLAETAKEFAFLDLGAGAPQWPPYAASLPKRTATA